MNMRFSRSPFVFCSFFLVRSPQSVLLALWHRLSRIRLGIRGNVKGLMARPGGMTKDEGPRTTDEELGDDAVRDGLADGLGLGMHVQFLVDATNVVADSVNAHMEVIGSGLIAITLG